MRVQNQSILPTIAAILTLVISGCGGGASFNAPDVGGNFGGGLPGILRGGSGGAQPGNSGAGFGGNTIDKVNAGMGIAKNAADVFAIGPACEPAMGQSVAAVAIHLYGINHEPKITRYVSLVGLTLTSVSSEPDAHWAFCVLNTSKVNAFSGPDGYVMITRGALAQMHDESELAGVLAHEIGHVIHEDGLHAAQQAAQVKFISQTASAVARRAAQFEAATGGAVDKIVTSGYSKEQEDAADAFAVDLVAAAGYDPNGYLHLMERLAAASRNPGESIMSTHPGLDNRVIRIRAEIARIGSPQAGHTLHERFTANVQ